MEKKGNTIKLRNEFDESQNLEIFLPNLNGWYRVISKEFRSFYGKRRINGKIYNGPVYNYRTNNIVKDVENYNMGTIIGYNFKSKKREYENF